MRLLRTIEGHKQNIISALAKAQQSCQSKYSRAQQGQSRNLGMGGVEGLMSMKTKITTTSIVMKLHSINVQHDHNFHHKQSGEWFYNLFRACNLFRARLLTTVILRWYSIQITL